MTIDNANHKSDNDRLLALKSMLDNGISQNPGKTADLVNLRLEVMGLISQEQDNNSLDFQENISDLEQRVREKLVEIDKTKAHTQTALDELKKGVNIQSNAPSQDTDFVQAAKAGKQVAQSNIDNMLQPAGEFYDNAPMFGSLFKYFSNKAKNKDGDIA